MTHPVVIGDGDVDLEDLSRLVGFQNLPTAVGGTVDVGLVVLALSYQQIYNPGRAGQGRAEQGKLRSFAFRPRIVLCL